MLPITSLQNPRVKNAVRLRDARQRRKQQKILIDGPREIVRAIFSGVSFIETFICKTLCTSDESRLALEKIPTAGGEIYSVSEQIFEKLAFGHRMEGMLAVAEMPKTKLNDIKLPECPLVAVLEGVEKPGNVGAALRSADAAGISALIVADARTDLFNPNAIRASMGTIFTVPVCEASSEETIAWLKKNGIGIFAARVDGSTLYTEQDYRQATAFILGSEADGLTSLWTADDIQAIRLPMEGIADSLNVSITAAVLFYEARRQRA